MKRTLKTALVTGFAVAVLSTAALAIDVKKDADVEASAAEAWKKIGDFCAIQNWHPAVAKCEVSKEGDDTFRTLTLADNGGTIKEKQTGATDTSYSYDIIESPLPVKNYSAKFWVEAEGDSEAEINWTATFEANGKPDDEAEKVIAGIFDAGLKSIKKELDKN